MYIELRKNPEEPSNESLSLYELQAKSLFNIGKNKKAMALLEQVVEIRGTTLAADHPIRLLSQHDLAITYGANGQVKEAVELLEQVVGIKRFKYSESHPSRVVSEETLSFFLQQSGSRS
jgi:tetratricopeptide (TPR) repeat protein